MDDPIENAILYDTIATLCERAEVEIYGRPTDTPEDPRVRKRLAELMKEHGLEFPTDGD